ncbi:hypothetical protein CAPTEDRAFT_125132 [Capitella teleta]|uniref:RING-type domain-containing protein n=1 Tax=Capitella teleta TaxID=283909 RepID=R7UQ79_CAPTE|nr:hypothetical protein CAPTEDRAFT_125132 [Capitella teleta]|eukprot:ELU08684.1 hypothetical protein CAPTEDRAFT_125132 [Capitella teleta]
MLRNENAELKCVFTCKVCWNREVNIILVKCGHLLCEDCAPQVEDCPLCKKRIEDRIQVWFSS